MQNSKCRIFYYVLSLCFFALGLMSKPMLVTLPFVLLLLDWWPLQRLQSASPNLNPNPNPQEIHNPTDSSHLVKMFIREIRGSLSPDRKNPILRSFRHRLLHHALGR